MKLTASVERCQRNEVVDVGKVVEVIEATSPRSRDILDDFGLELLVHEMSRRAKTGLR